MRKLSDKKYTDVLNDLQDLRYSTRDIANRNQVVAPFIYTVAKKNNVDMAARAIARKANNVYNYQGRPKNKNYNKIRADFQEGRLSVLEIANKYEISHRTVYAICSDSSELKTNRRIKLLINRKNILAIKIVEIDKEIANLEKTPGE
jgi:predicted DNA-binding protein YlxM (UPF0122 family)